MRALSRTISLRQAERNRTRTLLMVLTVALGVAAWITTRLLDRTLSRALRSAATPSAVLADLHISNGDPGIPGALAARLSSVRGVRSVRSVLIQRVLLPDHGQKSALLVGVDLAARRQGDHAVGLIVEGGSPASFLKALLLRQDPVLVGRGLSRELPEPSARLRVLAAGKPTFMTRVGTIDARGPAGALGGNILLTDLAVAARLIGRPDRVSRLDVSLEPGADPALVRSRLESALAGAGQVFTPEASDQRAAGALTGLRMGFSLGGAGALGLGLFLMASTLAVVTSERRQEIGVLRALGATQAQIGGLFLGEAVLLGTAGAALGIPLGWGLARLGLGPMMRALSDVFLPLEAEHLDIDAFTVAGGLLAGVLTTVLAALVPTLRAAAQTPVEAMSQEPADAKGNLARVLFVAALALWSLGVVCFQGALHLSPRARSFAALTFVVLGTVLAFPALVAVAARLLRRLAEYGFGTSGRLASDHLVRTPGRSGFVVAALTSGVALIVQTGGVIHGNAAVIRDWVDRGIVGDLFVTSGGPLSASGQILPMRAELGTRIEAELPGARVVPMRFVSLDWRQAGLRTRIRLLALDAQRYVDATRDLRPPLADRELYQQLVAPGTVLVSENFAALYQIEVGQRIALAGVKGPVPLRVVGKVVDFSCNSGTVIVDRVRYARLFDAESADLFSVVLPATMTDDAARRRIQQAPWTTELGLSVLTRPELRRHILGMVDRLFAVAYIQEVAVAVVGTLGVATALWISLRQRTRELGLLRAIGATQGQVRLVVLAEASLLTLLGLVFGLLGGMALQWYVLRVILLEESGFVFPVQIPWVHGALASLLMVLSGAVAVVGPLLSASRLRIPEAIAFE